MRPVIKYISFYDFADSGIARNCSVAAANKMDYIIESLVRIGYDVEVVSASACIESGTFRWYKSRVEERQPHVKTRFFSSFRCRSKILVLLRLIWGVLQLLSYLLFCVKKGESIWVYHSLYYYNVILLAKKIKKFKLILEVEEIYQDVSPVPRYMERWECKMIDVADKFVFSTDLLNDKVNRQKKPHLVIYGTYRCVPVMSERHGDNKVHVVYSGTLDPNKGGAMAAAGVAASLPSTYRVHILGFGNPGEIQAIKELCEEMSGKGGAVVSYDGVLKGSAYIDFLQTCQIGLSTQNPDAAFNNTSFPSKILSYMSNGLQVVSADIEAVRRAYGISGYIYYYQKQEPSDIANAILNVDLDNPFDTRAVVQSLDNRFVEQLSLFLRDRV